MSFPATFAYARLSPVSSSFFSPCCSLLSTLFLLRSFKAVCARIRIYLYKVFSRILVLCCCSLLPPLLLERRFDTTRGFVRHAPSVRLSSSSSRRRLVVGIRLLNRKRDRGGNDVVGHDRGDGARDWVEDTRFTCSTFDRVRGQSASGRVAVTMCSSGNT